MRYSGALLFSILLGCSPAAMQVHESLQQQAQHYPVNGRDGWLINQKLSFGPYASEKVKRGWTFSYDIPFLLQFSGAREKFQFTLREGENWAEIFCLGKASQKELSVLAGQFSLSLQDKDVFSGLIVTSATTQPWKFLVQKNYNKLPGKDFSGIIQQEDQQIQLREIQHTAAGKKSLGGPLGYEFVLNNAVLGAVETVNKGKVIIQDDIPEELKRVVAGSAAALLLRTQLSDAMEAI